MCAWFLLHCLVFKEHHTRFFVRSFVAPCKIPRRTSLCTSSSFCCVAPRYDQKLLRVQAVSEAFASWVSFYNITSFLILVNNFFEIIFKLWKISYFAVFTFCCPFLSIGWRLVLYYTFLFSLSTLYFHFSCFIINNVKNRYHFFNLKEYNYMYLCVPIMVQNGGFIFND